MFSNEDIKIFDQPTLDKMIAEVKQEMEVMKLNDFIDENGETLKWVESKILKKYTERLVDLMAMADADYEQDQLQAQAESEAIAQAEAEAEAQADYDAQCEYESQQCPDEYYEDGVD